MPILSLCTGYGGLDMAVQALTGDEVAYVADNDAAASLVLAHHWPNVPNIGDITAYDFTQLADRVDKVTAGFSCQDISNAGKREGIGGDRSKIWKDVCRAIRDIRPGYAFLENVGAIRSRGLDVVAEDLAIVGYDLWWTSLRASDVGAAHIRLRWFGVATPHAAAQDPHGAARAQRLRAAPGQAQEGGHGPTLDDEVSFLLPHADSGGRDGRTRDQPAPQGRDEPAHARHSPAEWWGEYLPAIRRWEELSGHPAPAPTEMGPRGGRRLAALFAEWLMGIEPGHVTAVPGLVRKDHLSLIGNGAMPLQAYAAYEHLLSIMNNIKEEAA